MSRVITFSRFFPSYHPRAGEPTYFVEKIWNSVGMPSFGSGNPWGSGWDDTPLTDEYLRFIRGSDDFDDVYKYHTIRSGDRWKVGDFFSPRVWSGVPRNSKQITFAPDIQIKKLWDFEIAGHDGKFFIDGSPFTSLGIFINELASNDGLSASDFKAWFKHPKPFSGQIICWNKDISY